MLGEPAEGTGPGRVWLVGLGAVLLLAVVAAWWWFGRATRDEPVERPAATSPPLPPPVGYEEQNAGDVPGEREPATSERAPAAPRSNARREATAAAPPAPASTARTLRVESDVPGAMVFVNRKYLGTTPLVSRDVSPGPQQLNVQVEGREPVVQTIEVQPTGETRVAVELTESKLNARVPVVHKHGMGSCDGTLIASPTGLRYQTSHDKDGFTLSFSQIETFSVDYLEKSLRVKQRGGRTWNFTTREDNADPLFVFHREVEAARK